MSESSLTDAVVAEVLRRKPMHRTFLRQALTQMSDDERGEAESYIAFMREEGLSIAELSDAYLLIVDDTFREELRFRETGQYRFTSFAQAQEAAYDNHEYMKKYMIGLALSSFWWLNHLLMRRFFKKQLPAMAAAGGLYREVGPGHGMYFLEALRQGGFEAFEGIDISATSVELTRRVLESGYFGRLPRANLRHLNFLSGAELTRSAVLVMGEVLEHVENPRDFLHRAHQTLLDTGRLFLTTCINAPAIDHLYNPGTVAALERLFSDSGFGIVDRCVFGRGGKSIDECEKERSAINVAYVLTKSGPA